MDKSKTIVSKTLVVAALFTVLGTAAQTQKKTYSETFNVNDNTIVNLNTSHADIEFDTWNKNQVSVEAVIELEGVTEEEAQRYFENNGIKILGNSSEIEISTKNSASWGPYVAGVPGLDEDFVIEIPDVAPFFADIEIPDLPALPQVEALPPMPPLPPMEFGEFDYEEYQERGESYLEEWSEQFRENFDEEWKENMKEWGEQYKANMEEYREIQEEYKKEHEAMQEERLKEQEEIRKEAQEIRREAQQMQKEALKEARKMQEEVRRVHRNVIISGDKVNAPKVYYYSPDGKSGKYKVKRTIKIKMPKSVKLNMNVRHGEVKLAETTRDIKATLSYARLLASTIDGDKTDIVAAYSPVRVEQWNVGRLNTKYSADIDLVDVKYLTLDATSSDVTINRLLKEATIVNNLGSLDIKSISPDFSGVKIAVKNGQLRCILPETAFNIRTTGTYSSIEMPKGLVVELSENRSKKVQEGYYLNKDSNKLIVIDSNYSEVSLRQ
ncbi:MAG: hypothetical protein ABF295_09790 [Flavobacteriaceae bacterium]